LLPIGLSPHKEQQQLFFDEESEWAFEVSRPHGTPPIYRRIIEEKLERSVSAIAGELPEASVLCVCAGSGMDAEALAHRGARVIVTDLSVEAVARAVERGLRFGCDFEALVCDVEHLPFRDRSVDFVYVHDGLHHLEDPLVGLSEMVRVARRGIAVTEPADALSTRVAVRLGVAQAVETAGNPVARIRRKEFEQFLISRGLTIREADQYLMYYRHRPGRIESILSCPGLLQVSDGIFRLANVVFGGVGNKITIQATYG